MIGVPFTQNFPSCAVTWESGATDSVWEFEPPSSDPAWLEPGTLPRAESVTAAAREKAARRDGSVATEGARVSAQPVAMDPTMARDIAVMTTSDRLRRLDSAPSLLFIFPSPSRIAARVLDHRWASRNFPGLWGAALNGLFIPRGDAYGRGAAARAFAPPTLPCLPASSR